MKCLLSTLQKMDWLGNKTTVIVFNIGVLLSISFAQGEIRIAAAANLQGTIDSLISIFNSNTSIAVTPIFGSSGKLAAQIREGAPFDIYMPANLAFSDSLIHWKVATGPTRVFAQGVLVIWCSQSKPILDANLAFLNQESVNRIAIPNPMVAPYGLAAQQSLEKKGLWNKVLPQLVFGESVTQTHQFVQMETVNLGFTALSLIKNHATSARCSWVEVNPSLYSPIQQGIVVTKYGEQNHKADTDKWMQFVFGEKAQSVLMKAGYRIPH